MTKTLDTDKYTIGSLLGRYERRRVILPPFQRSFSWEKAQLNQFWDDLVLFEEEFAGAPQTASYFLGPIVVIQQEDHIELLDGQQRLATATIALAAMRDAARALDKTGSTKGADLARDIQRELVEKDTDPVSYSLTLGQLDEPFFVKAIKNDPPSFPISKLRSHKLMVTAYQIANDRIASLLKGKSYGEALRILKSLRDALSKGMTLIGIVVQNEEDAYTIFETLNDRGLRLSVPDLVLNLLMKRSPDETSRQMVRHHWNAMLQQMGRRDVSRFLRHMWVSRYGDLKSEGLFSAIKRHIDDSKLNSVDFAEQCADECDSYVALLDVNVPMSKEVLSDLEGIVKYLRIASAPPLLLSGYRCLSEQDFGRLTKSILATYIRYVLVSNQNPLDLESAFYEAAREIRSLAAQDEHSAKQYRAAKERLKQLSVEDEVLEKAAQDLFLERAEAVWLMVQIANSKQSATKELAMNKANLEHVFPQNAGAAWPNRDKLEPYIWHVGNLSILGHRLNRNAKNRGFVEKCTYYYKKSEIKMTKELLSFTQWDESTILNRAEELGKKIAELWPAL
jgi:cell division protein FtsL